MEDVLVRLRESGCRLGVVTAKRRDTAQLAFDRTGLGHLFEAVVGGDETRAPQARPRAAPARSRAPWRGPGDERVRRRLAVRHARREGCRDVRGRGDVGPHPRPVARSRRRSRTRSSTRPRNSLPSSPDAAARAAELRDLLTARSSRTTSTTRRSWRTPRTTRSTTSSPRSRPSIPVLVTPDSPDAPRRRALGPLREGAAPRADGLAREGHDRRGASQVGRRRPQAPRDG